MKRLSKAQENAIADAKRQIDDARAYETFEEYEGETNRWCKNHGGAEYVRNNIERYEEYRKYYEERRKGNALVTCGKNTIEALVKMGVFTVVDYDKNRKQGVIDWVHLNEFYWKQ